MKVGDVVKLKKAKAYQLALDGLVGIVVEFVPTTTNEVTGQDICRVFWPTGFIDQVWRKGSELEVISESR
jgi:hypothetical protein